MPDFFREWCQNYGTSSADDIIEAIEQQTEDITSVIEEQTQQQQEQYEEFTSDEYDEDGVEDSISSLSSSTEDVDDSEYTGLFTYLFDSFYDNLGDEENYNTIKSVTFYLPFVNSDEGITVYSNILSNMIDDTVFATMLNVFYFTVFRTVCF